MKKRYFFIGIGLVMFFCFLTFHLQNRPLGKFNSLIPIYPGAKIQSSMNFKDGAQIVFITTDDSKKIFEFFKNELTKKGWIVRLERYGKHIVHDQTGDISCIDNEFIENTAFIALYKQNIGLMIDTSAMGKNTEATLYIGHTIE